MGTIGGGAGCMGADACGSGGDGIAAAGGAMTGAGGGAETGCGLGVAQAARSMAAAMLAQTAFALAKPEGEP